MMRQTLCTAMLLLFVPVLPAQEAAPRTMGTIATGDAQISGGLEVTAQQARLISNAGITAFDHTAQIALDRGGDVLVCAASGLHLLRSGTGDALLFALDRGALEIHSPARMQDTILTPDLRFSMLTTGALDLRMRVTREGDTCVENRGDLAPVLKIVEGFGDATYHLAPGQHVLFQHGSVRDVVDREPLPCGCPSAPVAPPRLLADSSVRAAPGLPQPSEGEPLGDHSVQASQPGKAGETLRAYFDPRSTPPPVATPDPPPAATPDLVHLVGGFFHRLFHRKPHHAVASNPASAGPAL